VSKFIATKQKTMLALQLSEAEIATLRYQMYHRAALCYPDALVQKRLHFVYQ
jgi:hypothetical protein